MRCVVSRRCSTQGHRPTLDVRLTRRNQLYSAATARRIHLADLAHDGVRHARRLDRLDRGVRVRRDADKRQLQHLPRLVTDAAFLDRLVLDGPEANRDGLKQLVLDRVPRLVHTVAYRAELAHVRKLRLKRDALLRGLAELDLTHGAVRVVVQVQVHRAAILHALRLHDVVVRIHPRGRGNTRNDALLGVNALRLQQRVSALQSHVYPTNRITSGFLFSTGCVLAFPTAIARATMPSMRPVAFDLSSFRLPAGSMTATAFSAHMSSTGFAPCRTLPASSSDSSDSNAGVMSLNPCPNSTSGNSAPKAESSRLSTSMRQRSKLTATTGSSSHSSASRSATYR